MGEAPSRAIGCSPPRLPRGVPFCPFCAFILFLFLSLKSFHFKIKKKTVEKKAFFEVLH